MCDNKVDILCLSEHWLREEEVDVYGFNGFVPGSVYCRTCSGHGGVAVYLRECIEFKKIDLTEFCDEKTIEVAAVKVLGGPLVIVVYRSPLADFDAFLGRFSALLEFVTRDFGRDFVVVGDFNLDFMVDSERLRRFSDIVGSYNLRPIVREPTRITDTSSSCIDNVLTDLSGDDFKISVVDPAMSDHLAIDLTLFNVNNVRKAPQVSYKKCRRITQEKLQLFCAELSRIDWNFLHEISCADKAFEAFHDLFVDTFRRIFPETCLKVNSTHSAEIKWYTEELRRRKRVLDALHVARLSGRDRNVIDLYKQLRNSYKKELIKARKTAYSNFICSSNNMSRAAWDVIKANVKSKNDERCNSNLSAEDLNDHFIDVPRNLTKSVNSSNCDYLSLLANNKTKSLSNSIFFDCPTEYELLLCIKNLKNTSSTDIYGISSKVLKFAADYIVEPLTILINRCITHGIFPDCLKIAKVVAVHKKGDKTNLNNYRPISVLPVFSKVFETVLKNRMVNFFERNDVFDCKQFGFRKNRSTTMAIHELVNNILEGFENGLFTSATAVDLTKAFDCVNHDFLLNKLNFYGIRGVANDLMRSYLGSRYQAVFDKGVWSSKRLISLGVPQGSVLGPIFFLIFINDLSRNVNSQDTILFADDTTFLNADKCKLQMVQKVDETVASAREWFAANELLMNEEKTQYIEFSLRPGEVTQDPIKILGIYVDSRMGWSSHIDHLCKKLNVTVFQLRKLRDCCDINTCLMFYNANFKSLITYGIQLWGASCDSIRIFKIQKTAIRVLTGSGSTDHCRPLFRRLRVLPLPCLYIYAVLLYVMQHYDSLLKNSDLHNYETRQKQNLVVPQHRLQKTEKTVDYNGIKLFNLLPSEIKSLPLNKFRTAILDLLEDKCYYSIDEFVLFLKM